MSLRIQLQKILWFASLYQKSGETSFVYILRLKKKKKRHKNEESNIQVGEEILLFMWFAWISVFEGGNEHLTFIANANITHTYVFLIL